MVNKCGVVNCRGNYDAANKVRLFRLPQLPDEEKQKQWIASLPPRKNFVIDPNKFWICERHWPTDAPMKTCPGGYKRPLDPPSIFNVPPSCLPTPKPQPRPAKDENKNLDIFFQKDKITDFKRFNPDKQLIKICKEKNKNLIITRPTDKFVCLFMSSDFSECEGSIVVHNKSTLCSPLIVEAFQKGIRVSTLSQILHPNNGLSTYSQFFEVVNRVENFVPTAKSIFVKATSCLDFAISHCDMQEEKLKKVNFLLRQIQLLYSTNYNTSDYCFALELFPRCSYDHLREFLTLPCKRKMQMIVSSIDFEKVLTALFQRKDELQKNLFLIVD